MENILFIVVTILVVAALVLAFMYVRAGYKEDKLIDFFYDLLRNDYRIQEMALQDSVFPSYYPIVAVAVDTGNGLVFKRYFVVNAMELIRFNEIIKSFDSLAHTWRDLLLADERAKQLFSAKSFEKFCALQDSGIREGQRMAERIKGRLAQQTETRPTIITKS